MPEVAVCWSVTASKDSRCEVIVRSPCAKFIHSAGMSVRRSGRFTLPVERAPHSQCARIHESPAAFAYLARFVMLPHDHREPDPPWMPASAWWTYRNRQRPSLTGLNPPRRRWMCPPSPLRSRRRKRRRSTREPQIRHRTRRRTADTPTQHANSPTSGVVSPCGSSPLLIMVNLAAALATTPSAEPKARRCNSSP